MGNVVGSFFSGFARVIGDLFGSPLDFLSGKSCSSVCGITWDFICYIENFCVANLLKIAMVSFLLYIGRSLCKMVWACFISCFSAWEYCCTFLCVKLPRLKRTNRGHIKDFQVSDSSCDEEGDSEIFSYNAHRPMEVRRPPSRPWRDHRVSHLRKSLRPRSHQIRVGISRDSVHSSRRNSIKHDNYINTVHGIRVTRTSKFVQKGLSFKGTIHRSRRCDDEETKRASRSVAFTQLDQVASDFALAIALQEQERRAFTTLLPTIFQTNSDELESDSSDETDDDEDEDSFDDSHETEEGLEFLEGEGSNSDQDMEEDDIDPDQLSYEELIALGEIVGEESRGLSMEEISASLHPYTCHSLRSKTVVDRCVICQVEYEEEEKLVALPCEHPYHADCITKWLQIKKTCPICSTEVSSLP